MDHGRRVRPASRAEPLPLHLHLLLILPDSLPLLQLAVVAVHDWRKEGLEVLVQVVRVDPQIPVEQEQQLLLHQVYLRQGETEVLEAPHHAVAGPMLILRRRVIQVLSREDERREEDAVNRASHALGHRRQLLL